MKNLYILVIIFLIVCNNLFSQSNIYKPFPQLYGQWIVTRWYNIMSGSQHQWLKYEVAGDTLIGSYTYKKVTRAANTGYPDINNIVPFGPASYNFAYRNDIPAKKVYMNIGINHDTLWYDFNLNVGDTIKENASYCSYNYGNMTLSRRIIQSIDSIYLCGNYYKRYNFSCGGGFDADLIEGIGFHDNFIQTMLPYGPPFEPSEIDHADFSCTVTSLNFIEELHQKTFVYPNPVTSELKISFANFVSYKITDHLGKIVLEANGDKEPINVSQLVNGIYIVKIQDKQGNTQQAKFIKQ